MDRRDAVQRRFGVFTSEELTEMGAKVERVSAPHGNMPIAVAARE